MSADSDHQVQTDRRPLLAATAIIGGLAGAVIALVGYFVVVTSHQGITGSETDLMGFAPAAAWTVVLCALACSGPLTWYAANRNLAGIVGTGVAFVTLTALALIGLNGGL